MTAFHAPDALPYPWHELKRPGELMTEKDLLENLLSIISPLPAMLCALQIALEAQPLTPKVTTPILTALEYPLDAAMALLDAWRGARRAHHPPEEGGHV